MFRIACQTNTQKKYLEDRSGEVAEFFTFDKAMEVAKVMCEDTPELLQTVRLEWLETLEESINSDYLD